MRKILVGLVLASVSVLGLQSPAHADNAIVKHYAPDNGYDASIKIACDNGDRKYLAEGESSLNSSKCPNGTRSIWLRENENLVCLYIRSDGSTYWKTKFTTDPQWHPIGTEFDNNNLGCVLKLDTNV